MKKVRIEIEEIILEATIGDNSTGETIVDALPLEGTVNTWGEEIYFYFDVSIPLAENSRDTLEVGELGYWPSGPAFCIFFGPTPVSTDHQPRAASPVNVFGKIDTDIDALRQVKSGSKITIS